MLNLLGGAAFVFLAVVIAAEVFFLKVGGLLGSIIGRPVMPPDFKAGHLLVMVAMVPVYFLLSVLITGFLEQLGKGPQDLP